MGDIGAAKAKATEGVAAARDELIEISLDIHSHPELAMKETRASALLADHLQDELSHFHRHKEAVDN